MRKLLTAFAVAGSLALSGCAGFSGGTISPEVIKQIQDASRQYCSFVPTISTIANILSIFGGGSIASITAVAQKICDVVNQPSALRSAARRDGKVSMTVTINGKKVLVEGKRV